MGRDEITTLLSQERANVFAPWALSSSQITALPVMAVWGENKVSGGFWLSAVAAACTRRGVQVPGLIMKGLCRV
jgi:hypothetical protein